MKYNSLIGEDTVLWSNDTHSKDVTKVLRSSNKSRLVRRLGIVLKVIFCCPEGRRGRVKRWMRVEEKMEKGCVQGRVKEETRWDEDRGEGGYRLGWREEPCG